MREIIIQLVSIFKTQLQKLLAAASAAGLWENGKTSLYPLSLLISDTFSSETYPHMIQKGSSRNCFQISLVSALYGYLVEF